MEEAVVSIFETLSERTNTQKEQVPLIIQLANLVLQDSEVAIPLVLQMYTRVAKFIFDNDQMTLQFTSRYITIFDTLARFLNGVFSSQIQRSYEETFLSSEKYREFDGLNSFNTSMIELVIGVCKCQGRVAGRVFGAKTLVHLLGAVNLNDNNREYSDEFIQKLVRFNLQIMNMRLDTWISVSVKINSHLQFFTKNIDSRGELGDEYNLSLVTLLDMTKNPKERLQVMNSIKINTHTLTSILQRIEDSYDKIRERVIEQLIQQQVRLDMFNVVNFSELVFNCIHYKKSDKLLDQLIEFIRSQPLPNRKKNLGMYQNLLEFINPNVLVYYPKILKEFQNFVYLYIQQKVMGFELEKYIDKVGEKMFDTQASTPEIFYFYLVLSLDSVEHLNLLRNRLLSFFTTEPILAKLLLDAAKREKIFEILQIIKIIRIIGSKFNPADKRGLIDVLVGLIEDQNFYQAEFPSEDVRTTNRLCEFTLEEQFREREHILPINQYFPIPDSINLCPLIIKTIKNLNYQGFNDIILKVIYALEVGIEDGELAISLAEKDLENKKNANRRERGKKKSGESIESLVENIEKARVKLETLGKKYCKVVVSYFQESYSIDSSLYERCKGRMESFNPQLGIVLRAKYVGNLCKEYNGRTEDQLESFLNDFDQLDSDLMQMRIIYTNELCKLIINHNLTKPTPNKQNHIMLGDQQLKKYINTLIYFTFDNNAYVRNVGVEALSALVYHVQHKLTESQICHLLFRSINDDLKSDRLRFKKLFHNIIKSTNSSNALCFFKGYGLAFIVVQKMRNQGLIFRDHYLNFHTRLGDVERILISNLLGYFEILKEPDCKRLGESLAYVLALYVKFGTKKIVGEYLERILAYATNISEMVAILCFSELAGQHKIINQKMIDRFSLIPGMEETLYNQMGPEEKEVFTRKSGEMENWIKYIFTISKLALKNLLRFKRIREISHRDLKEKTFNEEEKKLLMKNKNKTQKGVCFIKVDSDSFKQGQMSQVSDYDRETHRQDVDDDNLNNSFQSEEDQGRSSQQSRGHDNLQSHDQRVPPMMFNSQSQPLNKYYSKSQYRNQSSTNNKVLSGKEIFNSLPKSQLQYFGEVKNKLLRTFQFRIEQEEEIDEAELEFLKHEIQQAEMAHSGHIISKNPRGREM